MTASRKRRRPENKEREEEEGICQQEKASHQGTRDLDAEEDDYE